jgi:hypothetical protein
MGAGSSACYRHFPDFRNLEDYRNSMSTENPSIPATTNKRPTWTRLLDILLRCAHVLVISLLFGGAVFKIPFGQLVPWSALVLASGGALILSEFFYDRRWPTQGRGIMVYLHAGLFGLVFFRPDLAVPVLLAALVLGMVGSHMPRRFRHWSFIQRR